MLSDGVDRSFGLEGLQALGKSRCRTTMKHINFRGCTLLSTLSLKAIANFDNLETLNLSGCTKLTLGGARAIGKTCRNISCLSLASCGECIGDALLEALVRHLAALDTVNLSLCPKIGEKSLKALSRCERLDTLNLTGCTGITDQAILLLSEGNFRPGLRHLLLAQCFRVGDTALSWITDGLKQNYEGLGLKQNSEGYVSLETLALKGTGVTAAALKGIRDRFRYSQLKNNAGFHGFWPLSRTDDRKVMNIYHERARSAAIIQARVRARRERDTLLLAKRDFYKKRAAVLVGARLRGGRARRRYRREQRARKRRVASSLRLQCALRCRLARKRARRQREKRWLAVAPRAATTVQKHWRGVRGRRKAHNEREKKIAWQKLETVASIQLQSWWRMLRAKRVLMALDQKLQEMLKLRCRAAIVIQCAWRSHKGVDALQVLKEEFLKFQELQRLSALRIKGTFKTIMFRKVIRIRIEQTRKHFGKHHINSEMVPSPSPAPGGPGKGRSRNGPSKTQRSRNDPEKSASATGISAAIGVATEATRNACYAGRKCHYYL